MATGNDRSEHSKELRQRAEEQAGHNSAEVDGDGKSPDQLRLMLHELRVHQIELEMQNDELRRVQNELEEEKSRHTDFYDMAPAGFVTITETGIVKDANLTAARLFGVQRLEMIGEPLTRFINREGQDAYYIYRKQLLETGEVHRCELQMNKADGTHFWAQLSSIALRDYRLGEAQPSASVSMYRIVVTDNTEARRADEALKEFSFKLESAMVAANMAWWEMDVETGAVVFSKRKAELLSFPPDRFRNYQDFMALVHPDDVEPTMEAMRRYYAGSAAHYECEYRIATRTGEYKWFRDVGDAVTKDDHGKPLKLVGIALDITDRKRAETIMAIRLRLHRFASSHSLVELLRATLDEAEAVTGSTIGFYHFVEPTRRHYPSRRGRRIR